MISHDLSSVSSIKGLIFDLDGTLVDSVNDITCALNHALVQLNLTPVASELVRSWIGAGLTVLCQRAASYLSLDDRWADIERYARPYYQKHCANTTAIYSGIEDILACAEQHNIPMAVLSNKPHDMVLEVLRALKLSDRFVEARGYLDEVTKKPAAGAALDLCRAMNGVPDDVAMIGDSVIDIQTARNAGLMSIAVTWGFESAEKLKAMRPDCMVDAPAELLSLIQSSCQNRPVNRGQTKRGD